jgi:hypothetical protein
LTQNLPKPLTMTSSPDDRVDLMISSRVSTVSDALLRGNPLASAIASMMLAFVSVMAGAPFGKIDFKLHIFYELTFAGRLCQEIKYVIRFLLVRGSLP